MAEILKVNASSPEPAIIARAAEALRRGEVIAIPTDTFYGLAANPFDPRAVRKVFAIKERPESNPLLLLIDSLEMAAKLATDLPREFHLLADRFWPGPLTIVLKASAKLPAEVTANTATIALRLPKAAVPVALIRAAGLPITATSANRTGDPDSSTAQQVEASLGDRLGLILDGGASSALRPSTIVSLAGSAWTVLRKGSVPPEEIEECLRHT